MKNTLTSEILRDMMDGLPHRHGGIDEYTHITTAGREMLGCHIVRTAEHDGRLRKYYHITEAGLRRIEDFKAEWKELISIYQFVIKEDHHD